MKKMNITSNTYKKWLEANGFHFINPSDIQFFIKNNISIERYKELKSLDLSGAKLLAWLKTDVKPKIIKKYINLNAFIVKDLKKLNQVIKYCPNGILDTKLSKKSVYATKGQCFNYWGKVTKIRNQKSVEIEEYTGCSSLDAVNYSDKDYLCHSYGRTWGRVSLMNYEKSIPADMTRGSYYEGLVLSGGHKNIFLLGNNSSNTDLIFPVLED